MILPDGVDRPIPERQRFGVRIVDAKNADAVVDPEEDDVAQLLPQLLPGRGFEMERIDILILFRRVLGVLHRPVGTLQKPLLMFLDVRMVGRRLKRDVERDFDSVAMGRFDEMPEIGERSELRMNRFVAAFVRSDGPRTADILRTGVDDVVASLAKFLSDRMDRRQVEHVESHLGDARQFRFHVAKRSE